MPIYEYECERCGAQVEEIRKYAERNDPLDCEGCGGSLFPIMSAPVLDFDPYSPGLIMNTGEKVKGHMGKEAPLKRRKK
jgi:putative FmdB family regulatory protein